MVTLHISITISSAAAIWDIVFIAIYIAILLKYCIAIYSWLLISIIMNLKTIHCEVMAASNKPTDKPSYHAVGKENIVGVDRKMYKSNVLEHFVWHRKTIGSLLGCACATGATHGCPERATIHLICGIT